MSRSLIISEWFVIKQLKCDNKKFVTVCPKYVLNSNSNLYEHNGDLLVYCVTNDDNVYVYDCIDGEFSGDVNNNSVSESTKLEELCEQQLIDITSGINFMLALTKCGRVYSWVLNDCGQLGHGNTDNDYFRPTIISSLREKCVIDVKCGECYSLALTRNGEVFEFGWNWTAEKDMTIATQVIGSQFHTIISIACGDQYSLMLTDDGYVFGWGVNTSGQLGIGNNTNQCNPCKVENLNGDKIVKISCGAKHSILLSENGEIYVFGDNIYGQIGDGTKEDKNIPIKLNIDTKFVDIASSGLYNNYISKVFLWTGFVMFGENVMNL